MATEDTLLHERYRALLRAARQLFGLSTLDDIVTKILRESRLMLDCVACTMYLPETARKELVLFSARGKEDSLHTATIPWDKGIAGNVFQTRQLRRIDDVQNDPAFFRGLDRKSGFVTRAMICMPLMDGPHCLGVLQAINPTNGGPFTDLDQEIFEGLGSVVVASLLRLDREKKAADEAKLAREFVLASEIQKSFLPPPETLTPYAEFLVKYQAARSIGGDFYTAVPLAGGKFLVAAGDVSGKGIPAALTTAQVTSEISALASFAQDGLTGFVQRLNSGLTGRLAAGRFIAATFLLHDAEAGTIETVCAGQFTPWCWAGKAWEPVQVPTSLPLGVFADTTYTSRVFKAHAGEKWLLFSDGINEGRDAHGADFGFERLLDSLGSSSPRRIIDHAWDRWSKFVVLGSLHDDACLALFAPRPPTQLNVECAVGQCKKVRHFIEGWSLLAGFDDITRGQIVLAVDEAFTNILRHTYGGAPGCRVDCSAEISNGELRLMLRDFGPPLDPSCLVGRDLEDTKPGGLGLHIIKLVFDDSKFLPADPGTCLRLMKRVPDLTLEKTPADEPTIAQIEAGEAVAMQSAPPEPHANGHSNGHGAAHENKAVAEGRTSTPAAPTRPRTGSLRQSSRSSSGAA